MSTATAVTRETAWLAVADDSLPALLASASGPFDLVQGFWPGNRFAASKRAVYVDARELDDQRASNLRVRPQYQFTLTIIWPVKGTGPGLAETEQQNLRDATDLVVRRVRGLPGDKTHGGRFLSVAENPRSVRVLEEDPEVTIPRDDRLRSAVTYRADDFEITG